MLLSRGQLSYSVLLDNQDVKRCNLRLSYNFLGMRRIEGWNQLSAWGFCF